MEAFPPTYVEHQLPLVVLSGLGERQNAGQNGPSLPRQESGTRITTTSPECTSERASQLLDQLLQDGRDEAWNPSALPGPTGQLKYYMKAIGRVGTAPSLRGPLSTWTNLRARRLTPFLRGRLRHCLNHPALRHLQIYRGLLTEAPSFTLRCLHFLRVHRSIPMAFLRRYGSSSISNRSLDYF
jgi:hypothetical protein